MKSAVFWALPAQLCNRTLETCWLLSDQLRVQDSCMMTCDYFPGQTVLRFVFR